MGEIAVPSAAVAASLPTRKPAPIILKLDRDTVAASLEAGWRDFKAAPTYGIAFGLLYALGGWTIVLLATTSGYFYFAYPLATGFALIAPFAAAGIYEVSRRLETGAPLNWGVIFSALRQTGARDLGWMALVLTFALIIWVDVATFLYLMFYGIHLPAMNDFAVEVLSTEKGLLFLVLGNLIGAIIAFGVFSLTVVSCPMLLDRDVDFVTAMLTSVRAVAQNKAQMLSWAAMIALWLAVAIVTLLVGLVVILPTLGHATWHLYRKTIAPAA